MTVVLTDDCCTHWWLLYSLMAAVLTDDCCTHWWLLYTLMTVVLTDDCCTHWWLLYSLMTAQQGPDDWMALQQTDMLLTVLSSHQDKHTGITQSSHQDKHTGITQSSHQDKHNLTRLGSKTSVKSVVDSVCSEVGEKYRRDKMLGKVFLIMTDLATGHHKVSP